MLSTCKYYLFRVRMKTISHACWHAPNFKLKYKIELCCNLIYMTVI